MSYLDADQVSQYHRDGYLVIENFWDTKLVGDLKSRIGEIVSGLNLNDPIHSLGFTKSIFTTNEDKRNADDYFLDSGYAIRFFWEEKAWVNEKLTRPPEESINKIGHGLHDIDPKFAAVTYDGRVGQICRELGMSVPLAVQSMYIFKQARIGGEVCPHQDGSFLYTEPQSVIGFWWALDDCTLDNGCLWAVPGSHCSGVNRRYKRKDSPLSGTEFVPAKPIDYNLADAVPLTVPKGSLVILHSAVVHYSAENTSSIARHAYSVHVVDGKAGVEYPVDNWLQRPVDHPFQIIA